MDFNLTLACCHSLNEDGILASYRSLRATTNAYHMNFILHFKIIDFFDGLKAGITAYSVAFAKGTAEDQKGYVLVTTDGGVEGGTVHAIQIQVQIDKNETQTGLELAVAAAESIRAFLKHKEVKSADGILATDGLHEMLDSWGHVNRVTVSRLNQLLDIPKTNGRRRNKINK